MTRNEIINSDRGSGGMYMVIPSVVSLDPELPRSAKWLYGVIVWKCNEYSYCWASNRELGDAMELSAKRVSCLISMLEKRGHIETEIISDQVTGEVKQRKIFPIVKSAKGILLDGDTPPQKQGYPSPEMGIPLPENEEDICNINKNKKEIITPLNPPQGGKRRKREAKEQPDWKPELFSGFWAYYPRGENKQAAIRAWDKLQPSDELIDTMAQALQRQVASEGWQAGIGIPYASTWLNNRRWEDEDKAPQGGRPHGGGLIEEEGVYLLE